MKRIPLLLTGLATWLCGAGTALAEPAKVASVGSYFEVMLGLGAVLALLGGVAWALKRFGVGGATRGGAIKVIGGITVGARERILVVEVADQWIVVGVASGRVSALSTMPRQENDTEEGAAAQPASKNFALWLKQTIDRRNGASAGGTLGSNDSSNNGNNGK